MRIKSSYLLILLFALTSCATAPAQKAPDWTLNTPKADASNTFFVGYASATATEIPKATDDAVANLISSIMQYIGVKVNVDSSATAVASLEGYAAQIKQTVTTQSNNRLSGFLVKDKYVYTDKKANKTTVYILASYITADLEKEKRRIAALFQEKEDAVAKPEAEGRAFLEQGRYYEAVRKFIEAAIAASGSDIDNAELKMDRNVKNATTALSKIRFDKMGLETYKAFVSQPFPQPFKLRLVSGEGSNAPGIAGANLQVSYQRKQGTRLVSKTETAVTDGTGLMSYSPPPPDFVGKAKLLVRIDFQSSQDLLDRLPARYAAYREALASEFKNKYIELPYEVSSNARNVPMAISIVDVDEAGAVVPGGSAQAGLVEALVKEKYSVKGFVVDAANLVAMDDEAVLAATKAATQFQRIAYGAARIVSVSKEGGTYIANAKATVKVLEIATGSILYSAEKIASGLASDEASARRAAYRDLGLSAIAKDLLSSLP